MQTTKKNLRQQRKYVLSEHATNIIKFEKKKILPLTKKRRTKMTLRCNNMSHLRKKNFITVAKDKNYRNIRNHCHFTGKYRDALHSICNLRINLPNQIPVVFHNGSNYDYHFIIKK